jgi:tetratricopeptide (TPR) repeat protein
MAKRYFNWKLAIVLLIGLVVLGTTAFGLRWWQRRGRAEEGLGLGNKAYSECRWEDAARDLGRYLGVKGDDVPILLKYADAQLKIRPLKRNNIQQAVGAYRAVLRVDKNNSEATKQISGLYLAMGMPGEAELIARRYLETNQDPEVRRILAVALAGQRKFDEAAAELKSIVAEHPEQILAYEALGQLTEQRPESSPEPPEHWFNEAVKNNPSSALAYISRAGFHTRSQNRAKALADIEQAEKLDISDPAVRLRLAGGFINVNVLDKAEEHLTVVQKATPAEQALWQMWAQLALQSRSPEKMLTVAETGLKELSSQPWDFMLTAAELFIRCGQLDRATDCILQLRQKDIAPGVVAFLEGLVADQKGQSSEAVKCWQRAIQLDNKSPRVRLALAAVLSRLGDAQSALRQLRTVVSENPTFPDGHLALARLLAQTGNWAETVEYAQKAMQLLPGNLEAILLQLQARMQILATSPPEENAQSWQDIKKQLSTLEEATKGALEVKLVQLQLAIQQRNFADAETLVTQLKKDHPSQPRVAMAEVNLLIAQEKMDEAISKLNEIVKQFPDSIEPVRVLAILLNQQKNREKCEATIKDALARIQQPTIHRELNLLLTELYTQWGQADKVYPLLNELSQKLPNDIPVKRRLLGCQQVITNPEKAQQLVDDIKSLEGEDGWQWRYEQARVWFGTANFKDRQPQITSLLKENLLANPGDQASRLLLAATYERGGDLQMALSTYRQALDRSPQDLRVIIPTVAALYKAKEYNQAEEILNRASQEKLQHPQLQQLQLESYLRRGLLSSASNILEDILIADPNNQAVCLSLALLQMRQNKFNEASQLLDKLRIQDPGSLPVKVAQIQLDLQQQKPQEALNLCNEIVNDFHSASAYVLRARIFASLKQTDKAIEDFQRAITTEPNNVEAWVARSDFYYTTGERDKAKADIQQALSLAPANAQIQKRAATLLLISGNPDKIRQASDLLDKGLESNPDDSELQLLKARLLLTEGTAPAIENATQILQKITQTQPQISEAWVLLGEIFLRQGEPGKAIDIALRGLVNKADDRALLVLKARAEAARSPGLSTLTLRGLRDMDPNDTDTAILLANTYVATGEPNKAVELLRNQIRICNDLTRRRCNLALAVALYKSGDKTEAQKELDALQQSEPNDASPLLAQVRLFKDDQLWNQITQSVTDWYQKHPKDTGTPIAVARELLTVENSDSRKTAEKILRMILNKDSNCFEAMSVLATLLQITERPGESAELYQKILTLQPDNVIAINNLAWIMCEEQGNFRQALDLTERGLKIEPNYIDLIDTRGVVYYRLGEFNKAIQDFTTCIKLYPKGSPSGIASRFHMARAIAALRRMRALGGKSAAAPFGEKDKAIEYLNQVLNSESENKGLSPKDLDEARHLLEELLKMKEGG